MLLIITWSTLGTTLLVEICATLTLSWIRNSPDIGFIVFFFFWFALQNLHSTVLSTWDNHTHLTTLKCYFNCTTIHSNWLIRVRLQHNNYIWLKDNGWKPVISANGISTHDNDCGKSKFNIDGNGEIFRNVFGWAWSGIRHIHRSPCMSLLEVRFVCQEQWSKLPLNCNTCITLTPSGWMGAPLTSSTVGTHTHTQSLFFISEWIKFPVVVWTSMFLSSPYCAFERNST